MIIPIGIDCGNADFFRQNNLRNAAFPFDWTLTYGGVSNIIKNEFIDFLPNNNNELFISKYNVNFTHNHFPEDNEKMIRRIERFKHILENSEEKITFVRKGHAYHHHKECEQIKNDLLDAEELDFYLKSKYPNLKFEIIVILVCGSCFDSNANYTIISDDIKVYNIATPIVDNDKYKNLCKEIFTLSASYDKII
jgi:hypothetical protein